MENNYDNLSEENFLSEMDKKNSFAIPKGYFDSFSTHLLNRLEHEQELAEFKILAATNRQLKFAVPQNYFSSLANILEYKYELSVYPELTKVAKPALKPLPADYFEALDKKLMDQYELSSELKEFPILSSIEKKNKFQLAPNYFENSLDAVKEKTHSSTRITPGILEQLFSIFLKPKMVFAMAFVLIIGFTTLWNFNTTDITIPTGDCKTVACLEKNELLNDNTVNDFNDENLYEMVDVEKLDKKISGENTSPDSLKPNENR